MNSSAGVADLFLVLYVLVGCGCVVGATAWLIAWAGRRGTRPSQEEASPDRDEAPPAFDPMEGWQ